jgi:sulfite exporter TauE/SafE
MSYALIGIVITIVGLIVLAILERKESNKVKHIAFILIAVNIASLAILLFNITGLPAIF